MRAIVLSPIIALLFLAGLGSEQAGAAINLPNPVIISQPAARTQTSSLSWTVEPGQTTKCRVNDGPFQTCQSPFSPDLPDGFHTIYLIAFGAGSDQSEMINVSFTLDRVAPEAPVFLYGPPKVTVKTSAELAFVGEDVASFWCQLDDSDPFYCFSAEEFDDLEPGDHRFTVSQTDGAGNVSPTAVYEWTIAPEGESGEESDHQGELDVEAEVRADSRVNGGQTSVTTGCTLVGELTIERCYIELWAKRSLLNKSANLALSGSKMIKIGENDAGPTKADPRRSDMKIKLNKWGRLMVARNIGGFPIEARMDLYPVGGVPIQITKPSFIRLPQQLIAPADFLFAFDSSQLSRRGQAVVKKIARVVPKRSKKIVCVGHTDSRGSRSYNYRLGLARAERVCRRLKSLGVKPRRFGYISKGETRPRVSNKTDWGRAQNRRVEIRLYY